MVSVKDIPDNMKILVQRSIPIGDIGVGAGADLEGGRGAGNDCLNLNFRQNFP